LIDALRELGYEPIAVSDIESALSFVELGEPLDAVLSDFKMPGMSGADLLLGSARSALDWKACLSREMWKL
jgi:CheY-like chemotaxis protein